jgi:hypothetical protein
LARFFPVWLDFGSVWLGFFGFGSVFSGLGSVRFSSVFSIPGLENRNRTEPVGFFKILIGLIGFFHGSVFSSSFLSLISFLIFLNTPNTMLLCSPPRM